MFNKRVALDRRYTRLKVFVHGDRMDETLPDIPCFQLHVIAAYPNNFKRCGFRMKGT